MPGSGINVALKRYGEVPVWSWLCVSNRNVLVGCVCGGLYCTYFLQVTGGAKFLCGIPLDALVLCSWLHYLLYCRQCLTCEQGADFLSIAVIGLFYCVIWWWRWFEWVGGCVF
jgi:hypothetical protein